MAGTQLESEAALTLTVGEIAEWMDGWYPPSAAANWDRVGLIAGRRNASVERVLLAVDPVDVVLEQALETRADMVITHHPLYLRGTSFVSDDDAKGRLVSELIRNDVALFNAHTNADVTPLGVATSLADLLGLVDQTFLEAHPSNPGWGYGRVGRLAQPLSLLNFSQLVADRLPAGPTGILVGGDLESRIQTVAVSGGSGDSFLEAVRGLDVDAYITADLRHHPSSEHLEDKGPALICGSHWATEWPWLPVLARRLADHSAAVGQPLDVEVSTLVTEPWALHLETKG